MTDYSDQPSPHYPVHPDWLAQHEEPVLEADLPIIDAHHHLWDHTGNPYLFHDFLADANAGHNIRSTIYMECHSMYRPDGPEELRAVGEIEFANGAAAMGANGAYGAVKVCDGIIGAADLRIGDKLAPALEAQIAAGGGRYRGIRQIAAWHDDPTARGSMAAPPPDLMRDETYRAGLRALTSMGLTYDAYVYHVQLLELAEVARACPDAPIIVNHVGGAIGIGPYAGHRDAVFADWRAGIQALANCPNTSMKLGGLGMKLFGFGFGDQDQPPTSEICAEAWRPYIEACIEAFGVDRCMFESNFPVDKGTCGYREIWNAFKRITSGASAAEKTALYSGTAARIYKLDPVS
jgi:L-fuconolactonase